LKVSMNRTAYAARAIGALLSFATSLDVPITVVTHRAKANPFTRPSILFRPHDPQMKDFGGAAGYRPRVRSAYYGRVYRHSPLRDSLNIGASARFIKGRAAYQCPIFSMLVQGSAGASAAPICNSSIEMLSGLRTNAMRPSRGGRLMVTPLSIRCWHMS